MSNQLEKLKSSIKKEYVDKFEYDLMRSSGFIPVDKRQNNFYVIINKSNAKNKDSIIPILQEAIGDIVPQFIPLDSIDFNNIFNQLNIKVKKEETSQTSDNDDSKANSGPKELSAEEMLVGIGWLTDMQLSESIRLSTEKNIPLDGIFIDKEYLNEEQVASYLQKKYGHKVITNKDEIQVNKSIAKMLPDDFTERKKVVTLSLEDGNKLGIAMLNPEDKNTIREISLSTGRSVNVYTLPYYIYEA